MPKAKGAVTKECESCDTQIPVACKTCPNCSYELIPEKDKKVEVDLIPDNMIEDPVFEPSERRRSVRAKRDKPDYYDALEYESKRQKSGRGEKKKVALPTKLQTTKVKRFPAVAESQGRATLTWQKEEEGGKKKGKRSAQKTSVYKEDPEDFAEPVLDDIPADKMFTCAVSLAEINRKLGLVMWKPSVT